MESPSEPTGQETPQTPVENSVAEQTVQNATPAPEAQSSPSTTSDKAPARGRVYDNILQTIGGTPLVKLSNFAKEHKLEATILAKLESFNPLSSIKDRSVLAMFEAAETAGEISPDKTTIIEATSGNTGVSLAFIASVKGYKLILSLPESVPLERQRILSHYGAKLTLTPSDKGMGGAIAKAEELLKELGEDGFMFKQFENQACLQSHAQTTAKEIWEDTGGNIDILVAGVGTGATITGIATVLKKNKEGFKAYAVEPEESAVLSGNEASQHSIDGIGVGFAPPLLKQDLLDGIIKISSEKAYETARQISKSDGIPCGTSSGAALAASIDVARMPENKGKTIIVILPASAEREIASGLFEKPHIL